jgi:hypothetical protein
VRGAAGKEWDINHALTVDALLLVGEHLLVVLAASLVGDLDLGVADDDAHLVILVARALALVLGALPRRRGGETVLTSAPSDGTT